MKIQVKVMPTSAWIYIHDMQDLSQSDVTQVHTSGIQYYFSFISICINMTAVLSNFVVLFSHHGPRMHKILKAGF